MEKGHNGSKGEEKNENEHPFTVPPGPVVSSVANPDPQEVH